MLNETNMLSTKISREYSNSRLSSPSIGTSWPSKDPRLSFESECHVQGHSVGHC